MCTDCGKQIEKITLNKLEKCNIDAEIVEFMYIFKYDGIVRNLIINYKFNDCAYLYKTFAKIILDNKKICDFIKSYDIIIPVPIHRKRKLLRGYNQTELIAKALAKTLENVTYNTKALIKTKNNSKQSTLSKIERAKNVLNAYEFNKKEVDKIYNKKILIFDDIYTTGNTIKECAKIINNFNPKSIGIVTIAKD